MGRPAGDTEGNLVCSSRVADWAQTFFTASAGYKGDIMPGINIGAFEGPVNERVGFLTIHVSISPTKNGCNITRIKIEICVL